MHFIIAGLGQFILKRNYTFSTSGHLWAIIVGLLLLLCTGGYVQASNIVVQRIGSEQGLPQHSVNDFLQDKTGFIWVATDGGLARFDGVRFKHFNKKNGYPFSGESITSLYADDTNQLWFVTRAGQIVRYDDFTDSFSPLLDSHLLTASHSVYALLKSGNSLWFTNNSDVFHYDLVTGELESLPQTNLPISSKRAQWLQVKGSPHYLLVGHQLYRLNEEKKALELVLSGNSAEPLLVVRETNGQIRLLSDQTTWCLAQDHISHCGHNNFNYSLLAKRRIFSDIVADAHGQYWFGIYGNGLYQLLPDMAVRAQYQAQTHQPNALPSNDITALTPDRQGNLWINTYGAGLSILNTNASSIKNYQVGPQGAGLSHGHIQAIHQQNSDELWVGTYNGLNFVNTANDRILQFYLPSDRPQQNNIRQILQFNETELLTLLSEPKDDTPLWLFSVVDHQWRALKVPEELLNGRGYRAVINDGKLWLMHEQGILYVLELKSGFWQQLSLFPLGNEPKHIQAMYFDSSDRLWISDIAKGVYIYDFSTEKLLNYHRNSAPDLADDWVRSVTEDSKGNFWVSTNSGLHWLDKELLQIKTYTSEDGLSDNSIYAAIEDANGDIWISNNNGINRLLIKQQQFQLFNEEDGLQGREYNTGAYLKGINGELYFGGVSGLNVIQPAQLPLPAADHTPLIFTGMQLVNQMVRLQQPYDDFVLEKQLHYLHSLELGYRNQIWGLDIAVLDFSKSEGKRYRYRLLGLTEEWLYTDQTRLMFNGLQSGQYVLQVQGTSQPDWQFASTRELAITIAPPWWESRFAYFCYVMLVLIGAMGIYWLRYTSLLNRNVLLQRAVDMRTMELDLALKDKEFIFNNISHEFRTPLTLIDGAVKDLGAISQNPAAQSLLNTIHYQGSYLLRLVNQLLAAQSPARPGNEKVTYFSLSYLAEILAHQFSILAQQRNISFTTNIASSLLFRGQEEDITQIFNNLLSNALKYTPAGGEVMLTVSCTEERVVIEVSDTGSGIEESEQQKIWQYFYRATNNKPDQVGAGIGLALVKSLAEKYQGIARFRERIGGGSIFTVELPQVPLDQSPVLAATEYKIAGGVQLELDVLQQSTAPLSVAEDICHSGKTLLLVEDNLALKHYLYTKLSPHYRCLQASNGIEALKTVEQETPDLIISDVMMPHMDGFGLCEHLKSDIATSHIPLILLTASADQHNKLKGLQHRANLYLAKPFDMAELELYIENFLLQLAQLQALYKQNFQISGPAKELVPDAEKLFLQKLHEVLDIHYRDSDFEPFNLADKLAISERQLQRKLKAMTQQSPSLYIRQFRLNKSLELLRLGHPIGYIAFSCGFNSQAYFTKCFREFFNVTPGQYMK